MLLSIISLHSPSLEETHSTSTTTSTTESIAPSTFCPETVDLESKFGHINYQSTLINLLFISDDVYHLQKLVKAIDSL